MPNSVKWLILAIGLGALVVLFIVLRPGGSPDQQAGPTTTTVPSTPTTTTSPGPTSTAGATTTTTPAPPPTPEPFTIEVEVEDGRVQGPDRLRVPLGEMVRIVVRNDDADEVHVHGYDLTRQVEPGRRAVIRFEADVAGIFEVELEEAHLLLFRLEVRP